MDYIRVRTEIFKLDMANQASHVLSQLIAYLIIIIISSFLILFVSLLLAFLVNDILNSSYLGFLIISGFYVLILAMVLYLLNSGKLKTFFEEKLIASFTSKEDKLNEE